MNNTRHIASVDNAIGLLIQLPTPTLRCLDLRSLTLLGTNPQWS